MAYKVILDAGHGGQDSGAVYEGRMEKDDVLQLALAVGDILEENGVDVAYTRTNDVYNTPFEKATMANTMGGDLFISIHRNAFEEPNTGTGIESLIYSNGGTKELLARNINDELKTVGYVDRGITERPNLVVLKRTRMPAVLVEVGFIDNEKDNQVFDENFYKIATAIADGILETIRDEEKKNEVETNELEDWYRVQTGAFRNRDYAEKMSAKLKEKGMPAYIIYENGIYKVVVGGYKNLDNAAKMEETLRNMGYSTYISKS